MGQLWKLKRRLGPYHPASSPSLGPREENVTYQPASFYKQAQRTALELMYKQTVSEVTM